MSRAIHKMRARPPVVIVGSVAGLVSTTNATTHAMGNIDVGAASISKDIILGITWFDQAVHTISSLTVGGVALAEKITVNDTFGNSLDAAIWTGDISSINGSQAISVTFNTGTQSVGVSAVVVTPLRSITPDNSASDDSDVNLVIANLAAPAGGLAFAVAASSTQGTTTTWGSLTERADLQTGGVNADDHRHTSAWDLGSRGAANETVTFGAGTQLVAVGAGFG